MIDLPEFVMDADNVYRTSKYIVKQSLQVQLNYAEANAIVSCDVFYKRTKRRDKEYEQIFYDRKRIDGKRLPSTMFTRKYVD